MTPAAEAPREPVVPAASVDDPPQQPDPDLSSLDAVNEALLGHWFAHGQAGNCIDVRHWYSFQPGGRVTARGIDHNACSGVKLLSEVSGVYSVSDGDLEISLAGAGSERAFDMAELLVDIDKRYERFTFAIGERPGTASLPAETFLDGTAFQSVDGKRFDSLRSIGFISADGEQVFKQEVELSLHLQPGLPAEVGRVVDVTVHAKLSLLDRATPTGEMNDAIELSYPAVVRDGPGWRVLEPSAFTGLSGEETIAVWQALLDDAGVTGHPVWAQRLFQAHFFPSQRHRPDDITVLSSTLPEHGRWTKSLDAPPVTANTP